MGAAMLRARRQRKCPGPLRASVAPEKASCGKKALGLRL